MKKELCLVSLSVLFVLATVGPVDAQRPVLRQPSGRASQRAPVVPGRRPASALRVTPASQQRLDEVLRKWEEHGGEIKTLRAEFVRYYYDAVFGERDEKGNIKRQESRGELLYQAPDKGVFRVYQGEKRGLFDLVEKDQERWICTGTEVYQYDNRRRQVTVTPLPPEMRGQAISQGPLPFIFGMKADEAKNRYRLRLVDRKGGVRAGQDVCIEVLPKWKQDLENFSRALVILDTEIYLPRWIQLEDPRSAPAHGRSRSAAAAKQVSFARYFFYAQSRRGNRSWSTIKLNPRISQREFRPIKRGYRLIRNDALVEHPEDKPQQRSSLRDALRGRKR